MNFYLKSLDFEVLIFSNQLTNQLDSLHEVLISWCYIVMETYSIQNVGVNIFFLFNDIDNLADFTPTS